MNHERKKTKKKEKETIFFGHECNQQMHTQVFLNIVHQQQQDKLRNRKKWLERSKQRDLISHHDRRKGSDKLL
jgi:hypothetical protein